MSICTVDNLRSVLGIGPVHTDDTVQDVCDAADDVLLPLLWRNIWYNYAHSNTATTGTLYFDRQVTEVFYVGQTVNVAGNGSKHNGNKTITEVGSYHITYNISGNNNTPNGKHLIQPYGTVTGDTYVDYTADQSVIQAATMIATDIWQSRYAAGVTSVDLAGNPMPYRMGASLISRVRSLIAHAFDPHTLAQ